MIGVLFFIGILLAEGVMASQKEKEFSYKGIQELNCDMVLGRINIISHNQDNIAIHYVNDFSDPKLVNFEIKRIRSSHLWRKF